MKRYVLLAIFVVAVSLGACAKESSLPVATGKGNIRAINTISTAPAISFLIEERPLGVANYKQATSPALWDDINYTFNFEAILAGMLRTTRIASHNLDVIVDKDYTFVISGAVEAPDISIWEYDIRTFVEGETVFAAYFGLTATTLGNVDVYFADPAIPPAQGSELGTLAFGESLPPVEFEAGEYVLTLTTAGDDSDILFQSRPANFAALSARLITVFDGDANDLSPLAVRVFNMNVGGTSALIDSRFPPELRFFHASLNLGVTDVYLDDLSDPLTVPFLSDHAFGDVTNDIEVSAGNRPLTYTAADNIGSILIDTGLSIIAGTRTHLYAVRNNDGLDVPIEYRPNRRSIETQATFTIINTAPDILGQGVDIYFVPALEVIDLVLPLISGLESGEDPVRIPFVPGSYAIYVTVAREKTVLTGPILLDLALGDVVDAVIYENVDPTKVDLVFIPVP